MDMKTKFCTHRNVHLQISNYLTDDSIAIEAWNETEGPIATLTVCLNDKSLGKDETYIDINNCPWAMGFIEKNGFGQRTGRFGRSGYCIYPVVKLDIEQLQKYL